MKNTVNRNQYEAVVAPVWDAYASHWSGTPSSLLAAISQEPLDEEARLALEKSAVALGFGAKGCCYLTLKDGVDPAEPALGPQEAKTLLEAFDPLCVVVCDSPTAHLLSVAYGQEVPTFKKCSLFGRTCISFVDFGCMMNSSQEKQRAWHLLKQLV